NRGVFLLCKITNLLIYSRIFIKWNMVFLPHICISKIEEYKEGIDVFALAYRNHTDDHYMAADR
ncbi:MAG: hypothetical protein ACLSEP_12810, partial [Mediterraneibacter gnavus]